MVFPPTCGLCGLIGTESICDVCRSSFSDRKPDLEPGSGALDFMAAVFVYEGRAEQAVKRLKYDRATNLAKPMSFLLAAKAAELSFGEMAIVPVPIHWTRHFERGFNQADLLAEAFDRQRVRKDLIQRIRATQPQARLKPDQREVNLRGAFAGADAPERVLLIDDVYTSGHTARECAKTLKAAGCLQVGILAFASG